MVSDSTKWVRRKRREIRRKRGNRCEVKGCGKKRKLAMAHIKPTKLRGISRGSYTRLRDWIDHPKAYKLVCEDHHQAIREGKKLKWRKGR